MAQANPFLKEDLKRGRLKREREQHKKLLATRDELLSLIATDLKNPLSAARSASELLLQFQTSPDIYHLTTLVQKNADTALRLIEDILLIENFANDKINFEYTEQNLGEIAAVAVQAAAESAYHKKVKIESVIHEGNLQVRCDRQRTLQVLANFICNSLRYAPEDSLITVVAEKHHLQAQASVIDEGAGIKSEDLHRAFDYYSQQHDLERKSPGLALYVSKLLVEAMGGKIGVNSEPNIKTKFYFCLPT